MNNEKEELNPYASPTPVNSDATDADFRSQLTAQLQESRAERARWTAICALNAAALLIVGVLILNVNGSDPADIILRVIGGFMVFFSLSLLLVGPLLWYRFGNTDS